MGAAAVPRASPPPRPRPRAGPRPRANTHPSEPSPAPKQSRAHTELGHAPCPRLKPRPQPSPAPSAPWSRTQRLGPPLSVLKAKNSVLAEKGLIIHRSPSERRGSPRGTERGNRRGVGAGAGGAGWALPQKGFCRPEPLPLPRGGSFFLLFFKVIGLQCH